MEAVVGRRPVLEAIRAGTAREVLVAQGARSTPGLREVLVAARTAGLRVQRVPPDRIARAAAGSRHQGVAARVRVPRPLAEQDLSRLSWPQDALVLALDGVTDPQNVGALARTAEAAGASALVLRRRRGAGLTPAVIRASAGALLHLPVVEAVNLPRALDRLRDVGFWIAGLDAGAPADLATASSPPGRVAVVVGSEGRGLSRLVRESCDELLAIRLRGRVASLNVSAAAAVALFGYVEAARLRQESSDRNA